MPRPWVMAGVAVQCVVFLTAGIRSHDLWPFVCACFGLVGAVGVQLSLAMAIPRHALGLGDVTASGMAGFATGYFGLECYLWFWLCMGVLGVGSVSYTHLDVYKRQVYCVINCCAPEEVLGLS